MSSPTAGFRRIVVALDVSRQSIRALEAAAALARTLGAELVGVYVEDLELVKLAGHPLVREIDFFSGEARTLRSRGLERQLAFYAGRARDAVERAAEAGGITWSFHTVRGRPHLELPGLVEGGDLVAVGLRGRSIGRGPGSTARALAHRAGLSLMIVGAAARRSEGARVLHDGSGEADEAVLVAAALQSPGTRRVSVLAPAPIGDEALAARLRARLRETGLRARLELRAYEPSDRGALWRALAAAATGYLVVPRSTLREEPARLARLLREGRCPLVIVGR